MLKYISYIANFSFTVFFLWYFFIHIGVHRYIQKFISNNETFIQEAYYQNKMYSFQELNALLDKNEKYIVIIGDSIIEHFPVNELLPRYNIINRGIGKDTSRGLLKRLDSTINNINISTCFIMIGHNDIKYRSPQETINNLLYLLKKIKSDNVVFLSILPDKNTLKNVDVITINESIKNICSYHNFKFVNIYNSFIKENNIFNDSYYFDGVHLNIDGYKILAKFIKEILEADADL